MIDVAKAVLAMQQTVSESDEPDVEGHKSSASLFICDIREF